MANGGKEGLVWIPANCNVTQPEAQSDSLTPCVQEMKDRQGCIERLY